MSNFRQLKVKTNRNLGEFENLERVIKPNQVKGKKSVLVGLDGGSTGSRALIIDAQDDGNEESLKTVYSIPSESTLTTDNFELLPQSESLYENMDSWIVNLKDGGEIFTKSRVLRGTKSSDSNLGTEGINSSVQKLKTPAFYINMIESIAYGLIQKYDGNLVTEYDVYVGCSLRPDDVVKKKNREEFINNFVGSFLWRNSDLGVELKINIKGVTCQTEPEAAVKGYGVSLDELPEYIALIEGGGSSIGVEILKGGKSVRSAAQTLPYGGTQLQNAVESLYLEENGGANLSPHDLAMSLKKGYFKIGRATIDMVDYVKRAKDTFAKTIMADVKKQVFDRQVEVSLQQLETILFSGKLFNGGNFEPTETDKTTSYSLAKPLINLFKQYNPNADYEVLVDNLIPFGNLINALSEFGGYLVDDNEPKEEEIEVNDETSTVDAE